MDSRRWQRVIDWVILLHILSYSVCLLWASYNGLDLPAWVIIFPSSALLISLVTVSITFWFARQQERFFWMMLSLALSSSLVGLLMWAYESLANLSPHPLQGIPSLFLCAGIGLELAGIAWLLKNRTPWEGFRYTMELIISMIVGITLYLYFVIYPALSMGSVSGLVRLTFLLMPLLNLGILLAALGLIYSPRPVLPNQVSNWLLIHLTVLLSGGSVYLYVIVNNPNYSGFLNEPLWALSFLLLVPAAMRYFNTVDWMAEDDRAGDRITRGSSEYLRVLLPFAFLALLFIMVLNRLDKVDVLVLVGIGLLIMIVATQVYSIHRHRALLISVSDQTGLLERQAARRAEELAEKNAQLQSVLDDIQHMAYYDALTNLPNRRLFLNKLAQAINLARFKNHMLAILFIDLDSFKLINDTMGHSFGDMLLRDIGAKISGCIRESDVVSRQGGDEFTVLLNEITSVDEAKRLIEAVQQGIQDSFVINDIEVHVAASIGVALYPRHGDSIDNLIKYADIAMYKAKELGRNKYVIYTADMNQIFLRRGALDKELRAAIQNEELHLFYQPQISVSTGEITGIESLLRWNNLTLGEVTPSELIPIAEENGLIIAIGEWVLYKACRQMREWLEDGFDIPKIAVNISPVQFNDERLVESVSRILQETGLDPNYLELEITEGVAMYNEKAVIHKLLALKKIGITVALDDFGTGYSCLAYLAQLPVDTLKIDRGFVKNIQNNGDNRVLVETIINMAHNFKIKVIAEGVDTLEQYQHLREKNCDEIQGYLISEPVSSEQLIRLMNKYNSRSDYQHAHG
ncbi:MAG: EAL domain-containing protein [Syntrophomonadaceae bacterium]